MEIIATASNLNYVLQTSEILKAGESGGIEIIAEGGRLHTTCTNGDQQVSRSLSGEDVKIKKEGSVTTQAKKVFDFIKKINPGDSVTLKKNKNDMTIKSGKFSAKLPLNNVDIPKIELGQDASNFTVKSTELKKHVRRVMYAVDQSKNPTRTIFTGVLFQVGEEKVNLVGTNTIELAVTTVELESSELKSQGELNIIIPAKLLNSILSYISGTDHIHIATNEKNVTVSSGDTLIGGQLIAGNFPNYRMAIPAEHQSYFTVEKVELQKALERAALLKDEGSPSVNIKASKGKVKLAKKDSSGSQTTEEISAEVDGEMDIYININQLIETVKATPPLEDKITLYVNTSKTPAKMEGETDSLFILVPSAAPQTQAQNEESDENEEDTTEQQNTQQNAQQAEDNDELEELGSLDEIVDETA